MNLIKRILSNYSFIYSGLLVSEIWSTPLLKIFPVRHNSASCRICDNIFCGLCVSRRNITWGKCWITWLYLWNCDHRMWCFCINRRSMQTLLILVDGSVVNLLEGKAFISSGCCKCTNSSAVLCPTPRRTSCCELNDSALTHQTERQERTSEYLISRHAAEHE